MDQIKERTRRIFRLVHLLRTRRYETGRRFGSRGNRRPSRHDRQRNQGRAKSRPLHHERFHHCGGKLRQALIETSQSHGSPDWGRFGGRWRDRLQRAASHCIHREDGGRRPRRAEAKNHPLLMGSTLYANLSSSIARSLDGNAVSTFALRWVCVWNTCHTGRVRTSVRGKASICSARRDRFATPLMRSSPLSRTRSFRMRKLDLPGKKRRTGTPPTTIESSWAKGPMSSNGPSAPFSSGKCSRWLGLACAGQIWPSCQALMLQSSSHISDSGL